MAFTYFFRDAQTLQHIQDYLVPVVKDYRIVNIWDAGCAHGPEPYSLAIILTENLGRFAFRKVRIFATDLDGSNLFAGIIALGIYPDVELKRIPEDLLQKYFTPVETQGYYRIDDEIRTRVLFKKHDLRSLIPVFDNFSLIVCKNVLLHLSLVERIGIIKMFHKVLLPGGFFAMEQTQKMPEEMAPLFEQVATNVQLYRKIEA